MIFTTVPGSRQSCRWSLWVARPETRHPPRTAAARTAGKYPVTRIDAPAVYIADTLTDRGRGVFANRDFRAGEVFEIAPVIILDSTEALQLRQTLLRTYDFDWQVLAKTGCPGSAIAAGYGGMYNHAAPTSLRYHADTDAMTLIFTAVRDIDRDQELTINYNARGGGHVWHDNNWVLQENIRLVTD